MKASPFDPPRAAPAKVSPLDPPACPGVAQREAGNQLQLFDTDIALPWSKAFLRVGEVAMFLSISEDQVLRLIDAGDLEAIPISANANSADRAHKRVSARSLLAFINTGRKTLL